MQNDDITFREIVAQVQQSGLDAYQRLQELASLAKNGVLDQASRANANVEIGALNGIMQFHDTILYAFGNNELIRQVDALRRTAIAIYDDIMYPSDEPTAEAGTPDDVAEGEEEEFEEKDEEDDEDLDEADEFEDEGEPAHCEHPDCPTFGDKPADGHCHKTDCPVRSHDCQ